MLTPRRTLSQIPSDRVHEGPIDVVQPQEWLAAAVAPISAESHRRSLGRGRPLSRSARCL